MRNSIRLFLRCSLLLMFVNMLPASEVAAQRIKQPLPAVLDNLHEVSRVEIRNISGQVVMAGTFSVKDESSKELEREARLTSPSGDAAGKGLAEIEIEKSSTPVEKELEIKLEHLPASMSFTLFVDDKEIMTFKTNKHGKADIELSTAIKQ